MGELVRTDGDKLPSDPAFRPMSRRRLYQMTMPLALAVGGGLGLLGTFVSPALLWMPLAGLLSWSFVRRRRMFRYLKENEDGVALIAAHEYESAAVLYERLCRKVRRVPALHSLFVFNRSIVDLETGRLGSAAEGLRAVVQAGWIRERGSMSIYYPGVLGKLAIAEALLGQLAAAETWQQRAHAACSKAKEGSLLLVDAVIAARRANFEGLLERVREHWGRAENLMTVKHLRVVRLLEAYALAQSKGCEYRQPSREEEFRMALARVREAPRGAYDYLANAWPEMREFLALHELNELNELSEIRTS